MGIGRHAILRPMQEQPRSQATAVSGKFVWQEELHIDHLYQDTVLNSQAGALLLFEVLQHPSDVKQWREHHGKFAGATHRVAWGFLDLAHPRTQRATSAAWRSSVPATLDVHLHACAACSATTQPMSCSTSTTRGSITVALHMRPVWPILLLLPSIQKSLKSTVHQGHGLAAGVKFDISSTDRHSSVGRTST